MKQVVLFDDAVAGQVELVLIRPDRPAQAVDIVDIDDTITNLRISFIINEIVKFCQNPRLHLRTMGLVLSPQWRF